MNNISVALLILALTQSALCRADLSLSPLPQGTPPQISAQTQQLILNSMRVSSKLPTTSAATPSEEAFPKNLPAMLYKANDRSANNIDNQRAYHDKIKQFIKTKKPVNSSMLSNQ